MTSTCGTCRFLDVIVVTDEDKPDEPDTICRRFPPSAGEWSAVMADDWCGEWTAADGSSFAEVACPYCDTVLTVTASSRPLRAVDENHTITLALTPESEAHLRDHAD